MSKTKGFFAEFKKFAMRGNVIEMAVGIVIGASFSAIVTAFVSGIINPLIGVLVGHVDFSELRIILAPATEEAAEVAVKYGLFIQKILEFIITAFAMFLIIRTMNRIDEIKTKKETEAKAEADKKASGTETSDLLKEIVSILKEKK